MFWLGLGVGYIAGTLITLGCIGLCYAMKRNDYAKDDDDLK